MCSVDELDLELTSITAGAKHASSSPPLCQKCRTEPAAVHLRSNDIHCVSCFCTGVSHKVTSTLGRSRRVSYNTDRLLVVFDGRVTSTALVYILARQLRRLSEQQRREVGWLGLISTCDRALALAKRLRTELGVHVYSVAGGLAGDETGLDLESKVDSVLMNRLDEEGDSCPESGVDAVLRNRLGEEVWFHLAENPNARSILHHLRLQLLAVCASSLHCQRLLLPESGSQLAARALAALAEGRGHQLHQMLAFSDRMRFAPLHVELLRPLRHVSDKELWLWAYHQAVLGTTLVEVPVADGSGVGEIAARFTGGLQASFPGTESAVLGTVDKLDSGTGRVQCQLCLLSDSQQNTQLACSAQTALSVSHWTSTHTQHQLPDTPHDQEQVFPTLPDQLPSTPYHRLCNACQQLENSTDARTFSKILESTESCMKLASTSTNIT